jgi:hypothetical protein
MVADVARPKAKVVPRNASAAWPLERELCVQTLYLTDGLTPAQIAKVLCKTPQAVSSLIWRRGWTNDRRKKGSNADKLARVRTQEHVERVITATAAVAESASVAGLQRALQTAQRGGEDAAKDFRSWAGGARDLVNIMRQARGLVDPGRENCAQVGGANLNLFFLAPQIGQAAPRAERNVTEIAASPCPVAAPALPAPASP